MLSVEVGQLVTGRPLRIPLEVLSTLIGGIPGTGKSTLLHCVTAGAATRADVAIVGLDAKRVELAAWRPRLSCLAVELEEITAVLTGLVG